MAVLAVVQSVGSRAGELMTAEIGETRGRLLRLREPPSRCAQTSPMVPVVVLGLAWPGSQR